MRQRVPCHLALKAFPLHCSLPFFMRSYFLKVNGDVLAEQLWENKLELRKMYCTLLLGLVEGLPQPNRQGPEVGCFLTNLSTRCQKFYSPRFDCFLGFADLPMSILAMVYLTNSISGAPSSASIAATPNVTGRRLQSVSTRQTGIGIRRIRWSCATSAQSRAFC